MRAELDQRFSSPGAEATAWEAAAEELARAEIYWISTAGPHVTPIIGVFQNGSMYFCTGPEEQKARNLERDTRCVVTTGTNKLHEGLDVVVEGNAVRVTDDARLRALADAWVAKYGEEWRFDIGDGSFHHDGGGAYVFEIAPTKAFAYGRGETFSQTRFS